MRVDCFATFQQRGKARLEHVYIARYVTLHIVMAFSPTLPGYVISEIHCARRSFPSVAS